MVIVRPDDVPCAIHAHDGIAKRAIGFLISQPLRVHVRIFAELGFETQRHVVKQRPQHIVAVPIVIQLDLRLRQVHRQEVLLT